MRLEWPWLCAVAAAASVFANEARAQTKSRLAVLRDGEVRGRLDIGVARREGTIYAVSALYVGKDILSRPAKKMKPVQRSYVELAEPGTLGKYKRWEVSGRIEHYYLVFAYEGKVKVRHEQGAGGKADVRELGKATGVVPLDPAQPHLAWLLVASSPAAREVPCANPQAFGRARVAPGGAGEVALQGQPRTANRFEITGDCGTFTLWLAPSGELLVIESGADRYERILSGP